MGGPTISRGRNVVVYACCSGGSVLPSARLSACVHGFERPPGCSSPMFFRLHFSVHVLILFGHRVQNTRKRNQYGVCEVPIMVGFGLFLFPRSQKTINFQNQNRTKMPISSIFFIAFAFWGLEPNKNYVVQDNPQLPLANERIARARNRHHIRHVCTHQGLSVHTYTPRLYNYLSRRAGP